MEYIIALIIGFVFTIIAIKTLIKVNHIKKNGIKAEGIVYNLTNSSDVDMKFQLPTIRFLTQDQEWITEEAKVGLPYGLYKKGQKINLIYDKNEPKEFFIISTINTTIPYLFLIAGSGIFIFSLVKIIL
jgi:hypothetical protein